MSSVLIYIFLGIWDFGSTVDDELILLSIESHTGIAMWNKPPVDLGEVASYTQAVITEKLRRFYME